MAEFSRALNSYEQQALDDAILRVAEFGGSQVAANASRDFARACGFHPSCVVGRLREEYEALFGEGSWVAALDRKPEHAQLSGGSDVRVR